jgi:hypothetical protein
MNLHAEFAPVAPIQILEEMVKTDMKHLFGSYHLFLAHHTATNEERFTSLIDRAFAEYYSEPTFIMDNSVVELGGAVDDDMIAKATTAVIVPKRHAQVIPVLPDVMGDGDATLEMSVEAYHRWEKGGMPGTGYMLVAQGPTWDGFTNLVDSLIVKPGFPKITHIGIPRVLRKTMETRWLAVQYMKMVAPHVKIHLLGFSDDIFDDIHCARLGGVAGIDSAVPVRYDGVLTPASGTQPRDPKWFDEGTLTHWGSKNIRAVRQWLANPL